MTEEIWKPIVLPVNLNGKYEISSEGRLKRCGYFTKIKKKWKPDLIVKLCKKNRYMKIAVNVGNQKCNLSIHRLVCFAFHEIDETKPQVNHKNGFKHDNRADNLEWCNQSENIRHAQSIGLMKYAKPKKRKLETWEKKKAKPNPIPIINTETGEIFKSAREVAAIENLKERAVRRMVSGERVNTTPYRYIKKGIIKTGVKLPAIKPEKIIVPKKIKTPKPPYVPHPIETKQLNMFNVNGDLVQVFKSTSLAADFMKCKYETFRKQIKRSPTGFYKDFTFKYA